MPIEEHGGRGGKDLKADGYPSPAVPPDREGNRRGLTLLLDHGVAFVGVGVDEDKPDPTFRVPAVEVSDALRVINRHRTESREEEDGGERRVLHLDGDGRGGSGLEGQAFNGASRKSRDSQRKDESKDPHEFESLRQEARRPRVQSRLW